MAVLQTTEPVVEHHYHEDSGSGMSFILGFILLVIAAVLFFYYLWPAMRNSTSLPQVSVPRSIDVNINRK